MTHFFFSSNLTQSQFWWSDALAAQGIPVPVPPVLVPAGAAGGAGIWPYWRVLKQTKYKPDECPNDEYIQHIVQKYTGGGSLSGTGRPKRKKKIKDDEFQKPPGPPDTIKKDVGEINKRIEELEGEIADVSKHNPLRAYGLRHEKRQLRDLIKKLSAMLLGNEGAAATARDAKAAAVDATAAAQGAQSAAELTDKAAQKMLEASEKVTQKAEELIVKMDARTKAETPVPIEPATAIADVPPSRPGIVAGLLVAAPWAVASLAVYMGGRYGISKKYQEVREACYFGAGVLAIVGAIKGVRHSMGIGVQDSPL
jgi:hypothetical protein